MSNDEKPQPVGIACPRCVGTDWKVTETRYYKGRLVRIRQCKGCQLRVRTGETIDATYRPRRLPGRALQSN